MAKKRDENRDSKRGRLDQPLGSRRSIRPSYNEERFGEISERFARFIGTSRFLVWMTVFVVSWAIWNILGPDGYRFDEYPFIFLTLLLSLQASYAAPLILLAQNRQADRDRVQIQEDRTRDERTQADAEYLTREIASLRAQIKDVATRETIREELEMMLKNLIEELGRKPESDTKK
ncbi:MAG: DUF1003 domain-containing protein [Candidatus Nanopelagicaceae bacterium]